MAYLGVIEMGRPAHQLSDKRFGRLLVLHRDEVDGGRRNPKWVCLCDCGCTTSKVGSSLVRGHVTSCGCLQKDKPNNKTHGMRKSREYRAWAHMKSRCLCPTNRDFSDYGGRGIKVCQRWIERFEEFLSCMGSHPGKGYSLDRIDVNGHYEPANCRWATGSTQARNTRRTRRFMVNGEQLCLFECAEVAGVHSSVMSYHLKRYPDFDMESYVNRKKKVA